MQHKMCSYHFFDCCSQQPTNFISTKSIQLQGNMNTPQLRGSHRPEARDGAVAAAAIRSQQHHLLPAMSPIVPRKQHRLDGEEDMMITSPMGHNGWSTPAIATTSTTTLTGEGRGGEGGTGDDVAGDGVVASAESNEEMTNEDSTHTADDANEDAEESEEERRRREEEEQSIALARQLMEQEALVSAVKANSAKGGERIQFAP